MAACLDESAFNEMAPAAFASRERALRAYELFDISSQLISSPHPAWFADLRSRLEELSKLQPNWNSYGARPIAPAALGAVFGLLYQLARSSTPRPTIVPTSDGSVQVEWHTRGIDLEIRVASPSRFLVSFEDMQGDMEPFDRELRYDLTSLGKAIQALSSR